MRFNESAKNIASPSTFALRPGDRGDTDLNDDSVVPEIAFLSSYNVPVDRLIAASRLARQQQVSADQFVLAEGLVDERYFYRCLAHRLGLPFIEQPVRLMDVGALYPQVILKGLVPYESANGHAWLGAPSGKSILTLLRMSEGGNGLSCLTIATPSNLSLWVRERMRHRVAADASFGLLSANSNHCAREGSHFAQKVFASIVACVFALTFLSSELSLARQMIIGLIFFIAIVFRLVVAVKAIRLTHPRRKPLEDYQLPPYTVLVALRSEARVVRRLVRNLDRLNYPRAKLEIKIIIEEEDADTLSALKALPLAPIYEIIVAPEGYPRTKPRALNVALPLARGELIAVFDAEDEPDPDQLRRAAEEFAASPSKLACLQAKLEIDNLDDSWLTRLFAIEYAALFEVHNAGLAAWGLPFPVSGSSNHFRVSALRDIHGWDAWNVTEDADIGLRLARFGYDVDALDSATLEEAPISFKAWLGQRRRWFKGWFQTLIGLTREPSVLVAEIGVLQSGVLALLFVALLFGPLLWIPANAFVIYSFLRNGLTMPEGVLGVSLTVLWMLVGSLGAVSLLWFALFGMKRQCLFALWPVLPFLPIYYCLHTVAAWMALVDLARQPFHWQKTEHGVKRKTKRPPHLPVLSHLPR